MRRRKFKAGDQSGCGQCGDPVDRNEYCWCPDNRDPIAALADKFPSPVIDQSDGSMWREEADILRKLIEAELAGEKSPLVEDRGYFGETETYAVSWYWTNEGMKFPRQWDGPVVRLWSRLMIRPVRCAGGYTWIILGDAARAELKQIVSREAALVSDLAPQPLLTVGRPDG